MRGACRAITVRGIIVVAVAIGAAPSASAQLRIVSYNVNASDATLTSPRPGMDTILAAIAASAKGGFSSPIDVLVLEEANSVSTTGAQFAGLLNTLTGGSTYLVSTVDGATSGSGRPICIYNSAAVSLLGEQTIGTLSTSGQARQTLRYEFRPVGYDAASSFYIYASHFKASNTSSDASRRNVEAQAIRANADALGDGTPIILLGDLNLYTSADPSFQTLTASGPAQFFDPVNMVGSWSGNSSFSAVHTQSPATSAYFGGQVTGGMDDRFDFQLTTGELLDGRGMDVLPASYWAFGNTDTHSMKGAITTGSPTAMAAMLPGFTSAQASNVLTQLSRVTDHLPVVADYQVPARMAASLGTAPTRVITGATVSTSLSVSNSAPVSVVAGADRLDYHFSGTGICVGSGTSTDQALGSANTHSISLATSVVGLVSGTVSATATSPQASNASFSQAVTMSVLDHASPSFASGTTMATLDIDFGTLTQGTGPANRSFTLFNQAGTSGAAWTASLDLDGVIETDPAAVFSSTLAPFVGLAGGDSRNYGLSMLTTTTGSFSGTYSLALSDENLPGAANRSLTLTVRGSVVSPGTVVLDVPSGVETQLGLGYGAISGTAAVTKTGAGTALLGATNSYSGQTSILEGVLAVTGSTSLAATSFIDVAAGATLDAAAVAGGLTIGHGQTLGGSGTIVGSVVFGRGSTLSPGRMVATAPLASAFDTIAVPEPASVALIAAAGGLGLALTRFTRPRCSRAR